MLEIGQASDVGVQRQGYVNQDSLEVYIPDPSSRLLPLLVIADGMGGYSGGSVASRLVIDTLLDYYRTTTSGANVIEVLRTGIHAAHDELRLKAEEDSELAKMGSTVVAVAVEKDRLYVANVGDSRAYLINKNEIKQISWDHSLVGEMLRHGLITPAEAISHPKRNVLTMSLSAHRGKLEVYTAEVEWSQGDIILLCSDGLWGPVSEAQIQTVVVELAPQRAADKLVEMANRNQGPDNISVIIARRVGSESAKSTLPVLSVDDTRP